MFKIYSRYNESVEYKKRKKFEDIVFYVCITIIAIELLSIVIPMVRG